MIPLRGHTSPETAYLVADYPCGFRLRCKYRCWLEHDPKKGFRFCSQTTNPKLASEPWNKPKKSTYARFAAGMYLADGKVSWTAIGEFPDITWEFEDFMRLKAVFYAKMAKGEAYWTINGEKRETTPDELAKYASDELAWLDVIKEWERACIRSSLPSSNVSFQSALELSILLLNGLVIQADKVSVGNGTIIDWRGVPSGEEVAKGLDPFDSAYLFICLVGPCAARSAVDQVNGVSEETF
jgi:hypothetical protein